jgi:hypothetical protein
MSRCCDILLLLQRRAVPAALELDSHSPRNAYTLPRIGGERAPPGAPAERVRFQRAIVRRATQESLSTAWIASCASCISLLTCEFQNPHYSVTLLDRDECPLPDS